MKRLVVTLLFCTCFSATANACCDLEYFITSTSVSYACQENSPAGFCSLVLFNYYYSGGQWKQSSYCDNECGGTDYVCRPSKLCAGWMIITCCAWDGDIEYSDCPNEEEYNEALGARELLENGFLLDYLDVVYPDGGDVPGFEDDILDLVDAFTPPSPSDAPYENPTGSTEKADPVFMSNGEYRHSATDLSIPGRGLNMEIVRTYGSRREYNSRFGYGWDINYNMKVRRLTPIAGEPNVVVLLEGGGYRREYTQDDTDPNLYERDEDRSDYLDFNDVANTFTLVKKSGIEYTFDPNGNLTSVEDENGNSITFEYDPNGLMPLNGYSTYFYTEDFGGPPDKYALVAMEYQLKTITDDLGRQISLTYDSNGLLSTITDFASRTWTYTYDPSTNHLLSVEDPNGNTVTYTYDNGHNLLTVTDANSQTYLTNHYYLPDDVVDWQEYGDGNSVFVYDDANGTATITDREGYVTEMVYSNSGQVVSETVRTSDPNSEPNSFTTQFSYNSNLELTRTLLPAGNCIDYTYNDNIDVNGVYRKIGPNEPNVTNDPNVIATTYTYDSNHIHDINSVTDPMGNVTEFKYDANGNVEKITYPTVLVYGQGSAQEPIVEFTYNSHGQVEMVTAPDGIVTKYEYYDDSDPNDPNCGKLKKVIADYNTTDGLNITTVYKYDVYGNIREVNDPNGDITNFVYNELGLLAKTTDSLSNVTNFSYNKNKKLAQIERVRTSDPNQITSYAYDILDHLETVTDPCSYVTTYGYNNNEEPNIVTDAEDHNTVSVYDERGLLIQVTDANGNTTKYTYTANGDMNDVNDAKGNVTSYEYDGFDRLIKITYPDDSNEAFGFDKNSNLTSKTNRKGETINYTYDALNRMAVKGRADDPNIYFSYDITGRVAEVNDLRDVNDGGGITTYAYDRIGRVNDVYDIESRVVSYEYNSRGLRTRLIYPDDSYITYEYDALSRLTKIKDSDGNSIAEYTYDELSRRTLVTLGNDSNAVYEYDIANRLTKLTNNINDVNITFKYANYDTVGNRLSCKINDANAHLYDYDNLYQLTNVDYNDGDTTSYTYDALGNRTDVNDGSSTSYVSNNLNQYTSVGDVNYLYDKNGNVNDINDGQYRYTYDCENRLIEANTPDANVTYDYDYSGRRVSKTVDGVTTKYCYDGDQVVAEYDENNNLLRRFVYGPGIDEPICMVDVTDANKTYYYCFDGVGSVVALSDANSDIVERYSYDVFGEPNRASDVNNPYFFAGRRCEPETGLYYYRARYYAHDIGRFLQGDPLWYIDGLNVYTYCWNNSLNWIDPYGQKIKVKGSKAYGKTVKDTLEQLKKDDAKAKDVIEKLEKSKSTHYITHTSKRPDGGAGNANGRSGAKGSITYWDPQNKRGWGGKRDPRVGLAHELKHGYDRDIGTWDTKSYHGNPGYEMSAMTIENRIRAVTGDKIRTSYFEKGKYYPKDWKLFKEYEDKKCKK